MQQTLVELYRYTEWADNTLLAAARTLDPIELDRPHESATFNTIRANLVHSMGAQRIWLARWTGSPVPKFPDPDEYPDLELFNADWDAVHARLIDFAGSVEDARLEAIFDYQDSRGNPYSNPLGMLLMHVVVHSMDHRVTCSAFCALAGADPGDLNIVTYLRRKI